ncbi:carbohydrate-binding domain-containing protein, partial [Candidatus Saccharibacteria bacterium]|nr:carbohydrate-binding domain-containing protein [Candidatus Saccharibacteria bacterium]
MAILGLSGLAGLLALAVVLNEKAPSIEDQLPASSTATNIDIDNGDQKIDWSHYPKFSLDLSEETTITKAGVYHVTGELEDAPLVIIARKDDIRLILDNVTIKNSTGPAIVCYSAGDLVVELKGESILRDGNKYDATYDDDVKGAFYSKSDLTFEGSGTLTITANYQDGIVGKDDLKFNGGSFVITAADDAIRGKDSVYIVNGVFNITSRSDGIKSTNETDAGKGFVLIENGHIKIAAGDDAIHAEKELYVYNGNIDITKSYEGLE